MALLVLEDEVTGFQLGGACYLATSQWEMPETEALDQGGSWRKDAVGPVNVQWQAARPRARGAEFAYPLMLAAMRAVVRKTRRLPPFVTIVDLSTTAQTYIEVARIGDDGLERQNALASRSAGSLARAVELLTTDDSEPVYYLGNRPLPASGDAKLASLAIPLAANPGALASLLELSTHRKLALPLVALTARQLTVLLSLVGVGLWGWSATQWWQIQIALDRYGPGLLQAELLPIKDELRSVKARYAQQSQEFARAGAKHIPSGLLAGLLRRNLGEGTRIQQLKLADRSKLSLTLSGSPLAVLQSLARFERLGKLGDLNFGVSTRDQVSIPIEIDLGSRLQSERKG